MVKEKSDTSVTNGKNCKGWFNISAKGSQNDRGIWDLEKRVNSHKKSYIMYIFCRCYLRVFAEHYKSP